MSQSPPLPAPAVFARTGGPLPLRQAEPDCPSHAGARLTPARDLRRGPQAYGQGPPCVQDRDSRQGGRKENKLENPTPAHAQGTCGKELAYKRTRWNSEAIIPLLGPDRALEAFPAELSSDARFIEAFMAHYRWAVEQCPDRLTEAAVRKQVASLAGRTPGKAALMVRHWRGPDKPEAAAAEPLVAAVADILGREPSRGELGVLLQVAGDLMSSWRRMPGTAAQAGTPKHHFRTPAGYGAAYAKFLESRYGKWRALPVSALRCGTKIWLGFKQAVCESMGWEDWE